MSSQRGAVPIWRSPISIALAGAFVTVAATSNWAIHNIGQFNGPDAPRTLPIGWGLEAPSGVVLVGVMIALRDALHEQVGIKGTLGVIVVGSVVSAVLAPPSLALASGATMATAEVADALIYERLRKRSRLLASAASNLASATIDSAMFLLIAFGLTVARDGTYALTVGKVQASLLTFALLVGASRARQALAGGGRVKA